MSPAERKELFEAERQFYWRAARDLRAASRDGDAPKIVDECLDEIETVYHNTAFRLLRERAGAVLASHRPAALAEAVR